MVEKIFTFANEIFLCDHTQKHNVFLFCLYVLRLHTEVCAQETTCGAENYTLFIWGSRTLL